MAYNQKTVEIWYKSAQIIRRYREKLGDCDKYFDTLFYSVSDYSYSCDSIDVACEFLKNKARTVSNRELKGALNDFVITSGDCYDPDCFNEFKKCLKAKSWLPVRPPKPAPRPYTPPKTYNPKPNIPPIRKPKQPEQPFYPDVDTHKNWWARLNDKIYWFSRRFWDKKDDIQFKIYMSIALLTILAAVVRIIVVWATNGFWSALGAVFTGILGVIAISVSAYVLVWILMAIFRCMTYNLATLVVSILLILGGSAAPIVINFMSDGGSYYSYMVRKANKKDKKSIKKYTTTYICTANSLTVRSKPTKNSARLGAISKGDRIEVYEITDGFAKILWEAKFAYVSADYIQLINN